jgi:hypothetical protein
MRRLHVEQQLSPSFLTSKLSRNRFLGIDFGAPKKFTNSGSDSEDMKKKGRYGILKLLRSPGIDSKGSIPAGYYSVPTPT